MQAQDMGLVDALADADLLECGPEIGATLADRPDPGPVLARPVLNPDPAAFDRLAAKLAARRA